MNYRKNLLALSLLALSAASLTSCGGGQEEVVDNAGGGAFYEIFVGSFCDSNGDGVGDLNGIKSKLPYLKSLGVSGLWLTPIHPSDTYHHYDVKDYYSVSSDFGTVEDFSSLCAAAKENGIEIIMDMVFNHTAKSSVFYKGWSEAFAKANKDSPYWDFYSWSETQKDGYAKDARLNVWIESNFSDSMPELNFDNPKVLEELQKVQNFWLEKGASGFRYDAVKYFYCDNIGGTISGDTEKNVEVLSQLATSAKAKKADVYLVGECWVDDANELTDYCKSGMNMFYFPTSGLEVPGAGSVVLGSGYTAFGDAVLDGYKLMKQKNANAEFACFVSNHDQDRWGDFREGKRNDIEQRKLVVSSYLLTPGTPFMYYGEEIEMLGSRGKNDMTDAMRRQAMIWGEESITCKQPENFTFTPQTENTVKSCEENSNSLLNHYKKVLKLRNKYKDVFRKGSWDELNIGNSTRGFGFKITLDGTEYALVHNCGESNIEHTFDGDMEILGTIETMQKSASLSNKKLSLPGYSTTLLRRK